MAHVNQVQIKSNHGHLYCVCYNQNCLLALYRTPGSDPQQATVARKHSLFTGRNLEQDQINMGEPRWAEKQEKGEDAWTNIMQIH